MSTTTINNSQISETEITQRTAVITSLKDLMNQQEMRFRNYITVLEKHKNLINAGSRNVFTERLHVYIELEEQIIAEILSIQKAIDPLEDMYRKLDPCSQDDVPALKEKLEYLKNQAIILSTQNKEILKGRIKEVRSEINAMKNNLFISSRQAVYQNSNKALHLDIEG